MKVKSFTTYTVLALFVTVGIVSTGFASDLAFYSGPTNPGWIADGAVAQNVAVVNKPRFPKP